MLNSALSLLIFLTFISVAWALGLKLLSLLNIRFENNTTEFIFTVGTGWADSGGPIIPFALIIYLLITKKEKTSLLLLGGMLLSILLFGIVIASYNKTNLALLINTRFLLPAILAYSSVICGYSISETFKQGKFAKIVLIIALLFPALPLLALRIGKTAVAIPVVFGIESREEYLGKKIESFNTSNYANKELDKDAYILFAGFRPYYLDHRFYRIYPSAVMNYALKTQIYSTHRNLTPLPSNG